MLIPSVLRQKARRRYPLLLRAWMEGEKFVPWCVPAGRPAWEEGFSKLKSDVEALRTEAVALGEKAFEIEFVITRHRILGEHSIPKQIVFRDEDSFFEYLGKTREALEFRSAIATMRAEVPILEAWCREHVAKVLVSLSIWRDALLIVRYLLENPRPGLRRREIPLPVHTKFIEENQSLLRSLLEAVLPPDAIADDQSDFENRFGLKSSAHLITFRLLDPSLRVRLNLPADELSLPALDLSRLPCSNLGIVIAENRTSYAGLPSLPNAMAIFGGGFGVLALKEIPWIGTARLRYWGDLDAQGFLILSRLREFFPAAQSLLMNWKTWDAFKHLAVPGTPFSGNMPERLQAEEGELFEFLRRENLRLEQERINWDWVHQELPVLR